MPKFVKKMLKMITFRKFTLFVNESVRSFQRYFFIKNLKIKILASFRAYFSSRNWPVPVLHWAQSSSTVQCQSHWKQSSRIILYGNFTLFSTFDIVSGSSDHNDISRPPETTAWRTKSVFVEFMNFCITHSLSSSLIKLRRFLRSEWQRINCFETVVSLFPFLVSKRETRISIFESLFRINETRMNYFWILFRNKTSDPTVSLFLC